MTFDGLLSSSYFQPLFGSFERRTSLPLPSTKTTLTLLGSIAPPLLSSGNSQPFTAPRMAASARRRSSRTCAAVLLPGVTWKWQGFTLGGENSFQFGSHPVGPLPPATASLPRNCSS